MTILGLGGLSVTSQVSWSIAQGSGRISAKGLYTAPSRGTGKAVVQARAGNVLGQASVTVGVMMRTTERK